MNSFYASLYSAYQLHLGAYFCSNILLLSFETQLSTSYKVLGLPLLLWQGRASVIRADWFVWVFVGQVLPANVALVTRTFLQRLSCSLLNSKISETFSLTNVLWTGVISLDPKSRSNKLQHNWKIWVNNTYWMRHIPSATNRVITSHKCRLCGNELLAHMVMKQT